MELLGTLTPSPPRESESLSPACGVAVPGGASMPWAGHPGGDDVSLGDSAGLVHCWKPVKSSWGEAAELTKTPLSSSEQTPRSHMSTSKSSFPLNLTADAIFLNLKLAQINCVLRQRLFYVAIFPNYFSRKFYERFSRRIEFLERSIPFLRKVGTRPTAFSFLPECSGFNFPAPPPAD